MASSSACLRRMDCECWSLGLRGRWICPYRWALKWSGPRPWLTGGRPYTALLSRELDASMPGASPSTLQRESDRTRYVRLHTHTSQSYYYYSAVKTVFTLIGQPSESKSKLLLQYCFLARHVVYGVNFGTVHRYKGTEDNYRTSMNDSSHTHTHTHTQDPPRTHSLNAHIKRVRRFKDQLSLYSFPSAVIAYKASAFRICNTRGDMSIIAKSPSSCKCGNAAPHRAITQLVELFCRASMLLSCLGHCGSEYRCF